jgi:putative hydroxymethylpyrimidine transport system substrate-binding protein
MSLASSHITRPKDLAGMTVGMAGAPSDNAIISAMVRHDGLDPSRIKMVNVGYNLLPALLSHRVDAVIGVYWTWEALQARMKGYPVNVMHVERWGVPNYCELTLIASDSTVKHRQSLVRSAVIALQEGYHYAEAHPQAGWQALHAADKTLDKQLIVQSIGLLRPAVMGNGTVGHIDPAQWKRYAAWLWKNHLIGARVDARSAFTTRFVGS